MAKKMAKKASKTSTKKSSTKKPVTRKASAKTSARTSAKKAPKKGARKGAATTTGETAGKAPPQTAGAAVSTTVVAVRPPGPRRAGLPPATVDVTMTIDFGTSPPADAMSIRRLAGVERTNGKASLPSGTHTAGWDVVSPTVRPITFGVKIVEDGSARVLLNRAGERTGPDGKGGGADRFTI